MFKTVSSAFGTFSNSTVVNVTPGVPYVLFVDGSFTNVTVSADILDGVTTRNMPLLPAVLTQTSEAKVFYAPTSKINLAATGAGNSVFYYLRMVVQPTVHIGATSYV